MEKIFQLNSEQATEVLAKQLAQLVFQPCIIFLQGDLGAGKTTFVRYFIKSLNFQGFIKSPTYTLVETYELSQMTIYHYDLYRLKTAAELELIGIRDYFIKPAVHFIEWPEKGLQFLPNPDIIIQLAWLADHSRKIVMTANSALGTVLLTKIAEK
ncbi:MAG: tRNA (adenosine(37)-N6)-threonylcarbamoyltransferase complex ATPase subunit type 1 TsaE [Gammaproteobacteria bacterium RIFCSPHIGHO2_12_FULL_35_23]|nr:MAG: tRNA (adenosine(37)-N6)-threonylcarbamoyltransferase complex ATPase subunit type 1 TsaE [Gammaproteobacteria bacterium RIFCSPHIGHO2_12_FULL_35_23]